MNNIEDLFIPFLLIIIALYLTFVESFKEITKGIQEFFSNLFSFLVNPFFIISIFLIGSSFLIISSYQSRKKRKRIKIREEKLNTSLRKKSKNIPKEIIIQNTKKEDNSYQIEPQKTYKKLIKIRVDQDKRYFYKKNVNRDEVEYLLKKGYQIKKYKNLLNSRMEDFLLKPRSNESFTHLFLTYNISEFLEKNGIETELFATKKPDIVFKIGMKKYAIEIETGSIFSKISRMNEKLNVLKDYDEWFFVVTDRNKVKKYKKYGKAVDKRYIKPRLDKIVKSAKKAQK